MTTTTKTALIVVDVQNDFISGTLAVQDGEEVAQRVADLIAGNHPDGAHYDYVVATKDWHIDPQEHWSDTPDFKDTWPKHTMANTWGAEFSPRLVNTKFDATFYKGAYAAAYSGFDGTRRGLELGLTLGEWLQAHGITDIDVVGLATDYCVKATALDAQKLGFKTQVLLPYTAAVSPDGLVNAIEEFKEAGVVVL